MNLVFLDRTAAKSAAGESFLTVQPDGNFNLSAGAVLQHQLGEHRWVTLAQDTDTNTYYLVFGAGSPERKPYPLRANKKNSAVRVFNATAPARQLWAAFKVASDAKSLRLVVGMPAAHEAGPLFPLSLDGQPAPAAAPAQLEASAEEVTIATESVTIVPDTAAPAEPEALAPEASAPRKAWRTEELDYLKQHYPTSSLAELAAKLPGRTEATINWKASMLKLKKKPVEAPKAAPEPETPKPAAPVPVPAEQPTTEQPRKTFGLQARAEELTAYWIGRDIERTTPSELGEILNLMRHVPRDKRSFEMGVVLERAEKEHTERLKGAGKGGNRA
jgi:hypothetical protein